MRVSVRPLSFWGIFFCAAGFLREGTKSFISSYSPRGCGRTASPNETTSAAIDSGRKVCYNGGAFLIGEKQMYRKEDHPRDRDGRFTEKGASEGEKLREAVGIYSDDPEADVPPQRRHEPATGFNRLETKHHRRHAQEMGFKSMQEYEKAAVAFFNSDKGKLYYSQVKERYYRYDEKTRFFCSSSHGVIHTFLLYSPKKFERIKKQDEVYEC